MFKARQPFAPYFYVQVSAPSFVIGTCIARTLHVSQGGAVEILLRLVVVHAIR
jgi:hypothetical protein